MLREASHLRGVLSDAEATLRDIPTPQAGVPYASQQAFRNDLLRRIATYQLLASREIASGVHTGVTDAVSRILTRTDRRAGAQSRALQGTSQAARADLYQRHLTQRSGSVSTAIDRILRRADTAGLTPRQLQADLSRLLGGTESKFLRTLKLTPVDTTPLRGVRARARLLGVTEIFNKTRDATLAAMVVTVDMATWRLSPMHRQEDRCDEKAGRLFPVNAWPGSHPRCACRPGAPFRFAGEGVAE
jgi:hypothetical protein